MNKGELNVWIIQPYFAIITIPSLNQLDYIRSRSIVQFSSFLSLFSIREKVHLLTERVYNYDRFPTFLVHRLIRMQVGLIY